MVIVPERVHGLVDELRADLRSARRFLRRSPVIAGAAVLSIAIGIGAAASVFSLIDAVLVARLPVPDPGSLAIVARVDDRSGVGWSFTYPLFARLRAGGALAGAIATADLPIAVDDGASVEPAAGLLVSGAYFETLGLAPRLGRLFTAADDTTPGAHPLAVLGHAYWLRRFGGDAAVIGRTIRLTGHAMTVIGVAPERFRGLDGGAGPDVYVPMAMQAEVMGAPARFGDTGESWVAIIGRLPSGVTREAAAARLDASLRGPAGAVDAVVPADRRLTLVDGARGRPTWRQRLAAPLAALGGLAGAILLFVWANVVNLLVARTIARQRELAVRMTLGAGRARIARQLAVEALLLTGAGGALGCLLAWWAARGLASLALPPGAAPLVVDALHGTRGLSLAGLLLIAATAAICGAAPALAARSTTVAGGLRLDSRTTTGRRLLGRKLLVAAQVALSIPLLVGAGLFARTLANLRAVDVGVETSRLLTLRLDATLTGYDPPRLRRFYDELVDRVTAMPEARSASVAMVPLLAGSGWGSGLTLDTGGRDDRPGPDRNAVGPGYFHTLGTALVAGREFTRGDIAAAPKVAIVNEAFARRYLGGAATGRRIGVGGPDGRADTTIVGVVRDGKYAGVRDPLAPFWYVPYAQVGLTGGSDTVVRARRGVVTLHVRTAGEPGAAVAAIRRAIAGFDRRIVVVDARPMRQRLDDQLGFERLMAGVGGVAAIVAALLCALGLHGLLAYDTATRAREIGVRLALGASRRAIATLVAGQAAPLVGLGLAVGLLAAVAASRAARALLFGLDPADPIVLAAAVGTVLILAAAATWLPARRAARVDPATALR